MKKKTKIRLLPVKELSNSIIFYLSLSWSGPAGPAQRQRRDPTYCGHRERPTPLRAAADQQGQ